MKKITLLFTAVLFVFIVNAQEKILSYYVGPVVSLPISNFSNVAGLGFGGEFQVDYPFSQHIEGFGQAGFQSFSGKTIGGVSQQSFSAPSVLIGARYNINKLSFGLGAGYTSYLAKYTDDGISVSPQIGLKFSNFNLVAHYTLTFVNGGAIGSSQFSSFGLKLFYRLFDIFENRKL